jgi:hypothetical protein
VRSRRVWSGVCWGVALALCVSAPSPALAKKGKHEKSSKHAEEATHEEHSGSSGSSDSQELAKKLSNPVSDLVSVPFQFNWENGVGPDDGLRTVLNVQPVVPFKISDQWSMIERWIMPFVSQPEAFGAESGMGDITFSSFFTPHAKGSLLWGAGPVITLPMSSDATIGSGQWSAGPTLVVVKIRGPVTYGLLWNQLWSYATVSERSRVAVNQGFFQPFFAVTRASGVTFTIQSETIANWNAPNEDDTWTIPIIVNVSKVTTFGPFPFSVAGGAGVYAVTPDGGPNWKLRAAFTLLLPSKK